jgi:hypothetical protein
MHELVHSTLHTKLLSGLRRPSFAGNGLPERMRSISFALLGLTAAAGLALVAIFAQPGFPLLSPAPLPDERSATESISRAERLPLGHAAVAVLPAQPAPVRRVRADLAHEKPAEGTSGPAGGGGESLVAPAEVDVSAPVDTPGPAAPNNGGGGVGSETGGGSDPAPTAAPAQPTASPSKPSSPPQPPSSKPEAIASAPKPEPTPAPGNSSSPAAAEHASERGIEASASSGPPTSTPATAAAAAPETPASPGNGNGLAKGHDK